MTNGATHALYRFYDATGTLLYIGITADPGSRWRSHAHDKPWWHEVRGISMEPYPDRDSVLAAERLAIAVENPRHNIQRPSLPSKGAAGRVAAAHPPRRLIWLCETCRQPVADGDGYIHVVMKTVHEVEKFWRDRDLAAETDDRVFVDLSDVRDWPDDAPWLTHHAKCDPAPDAFDYWFDVKRARTHAHLLSWTAHLMEKNWLTYTDWAAFIQRQAGVDA